MGRRYRQTAKRDANALPQSHQVVKESEMQWPMRTFSLHVATRILPQIHQIAKDNVRGGRCGGFLTALCQDACRIHIGLLKISNTEYNIMVFNT
jgi:hypothetical protein